MYTEDISLGKFKHIVHLYKNKYDLTESVENDYIMLRAYRYENGVIYDTDVYFVERDIWNEYKNRLSVNSDDYTSGLIFPKSDLEYDDFSLLLSSFNSDMSVNDEIFLYDLYSLYETEDSKYEMRKTKIHCDKLRIFRPTVYHDLPFIIHCDTFINNLHVHLLCRDIRYYTERHGDETRGVVKEFENGHDTYSEYVEFYIPDVEELFGGDVFFIENLNFCEIDNQTDDENFYNYIVKDSKTNNFYHSLYLYNIPYRLDLTENNIDTSFLPNDNRFDVVTTTNYKKIYLPQYLFTTNKAQVKNHISITLHPYDINEKTVVQSKQLKDYPNVYDRVIYGFNDDYEYVNNSLYYENRDLFNEENRITLDAYLGFDDDGELAIINKFNYPLKENFKTFREAYEYYNGVNLDEYCDILDDEDTDWYDPEDDENKQCGIKVSVYADMFQSDLMYYTIIPYKNVNEIGDFAFKLTSLMDYWTDWKGVFYARCEFIDKYLGKRTYGSVVTIIKEKAKYIINQSKKQKVFDEKDHNKYDTISDIRMDNTKLRFLENITCVINDSSKTTQQPITNNNIGSGLTKILYKPIFFKVHDVNSIVLRQNLTQNVGINLSDYMTKVETFIMLINNIKITEYARNGAYVIFNITTSSISSSTSGGEYHILTQDSEYITSGTYTIK